MAIFDIFEEVSEKTAQKTETGDNRIFGVVVGEVVYNWSEQMPGRVCVSIHTRDNEANILKWARVASLSGGTDWGHYFLPEVGDQVLVVFEQGVIDRPYVIGCIQKASDAFLRKSKHEKNQHKRIVTRHGSTIEFEDVESDNPSEADGAGDKIRIYTAGERHNILMDNSAKKIYIADKDKNAEITMETEKGNIIIHAARKLTIKVGDNIKIDMNGESGKINVSSNDIQVEASGKIKMNATGQMALSGSSFEATSSSMMKLASDNGLFKASGQAVQIG